MTKWYKRTAVLLAVSMLSTSAGFTAMAEEPIVSAAEEEDIQISDDAAEEESSREGEQGSESDAESRAESPDGKEEEVTDSPDEKDTGADSQNPEVPEMLSENPDSTPGGEDNEKKEADGQKKEDADEEIAEEEQEEKEALQPRADASHMGAEIFSDVGKGEWYYSYVSWVMNKGIMTGMGDGSFAPAEALSRAQFATVLWRMSGSPDVAYTKTYRDVPDGQFYTKPVLWASQSEVGIITGYGDGKFGPADLITREQMATMLYRYTKYKKLETEKPVKLDRFPDAGSVNDFAKDAVQWAVAVQMIQGDNKKLNPQGATSRAVCATMIERFSEKHMPGAFADIEIYGRVKDIAVGSADAATGAFDVTFYGLETSFPVKKLETAVWCADDKSDIQWYTAEKIGNGNWRFEGNVREHQYHFGTYKFESSVLLSNGLRLRLGSKEAWFEGSVAQMRVNGHVNNILNETGWDLYNAYWWVASHVTYKTLPIHVEPPEGYTRDQWYALMAYEEGQGNCFVYAAAFYQLAKGLGYDVEYVEGQVGMAAGGYGPHGWTVIHIDGASYICDPEAQYEVGSYNFYMQPIGNTIFNYVW